MDNKRLKKLAGIAGLEEIFPKKKIHDVSSAGLAATLDRVYHISKGNKNKIQKAIDPNWGSWSSKEREIVGDFLNDLADSLLGKPNDD